MMIVVMAAMTGVAEMMAVVAEATLVGIINVLINMHALC